MLSFLLLAVLSDPAAFVRSFYDQNQRGLPDPVYQVRTRASIGQWFDKPIADLIWRDLVDAMGEVGRMDGHYLYDAQDNEIRNLQIRMLEQKGDTARVLATFDFGPEQKRSAEFHLKSTAEGWRIANIVYAHSSYLEILQADFPPPEIEDERAEKAVCELYEDYPVAVPEGYDPVHEAIDLAEMFANGNEVEQDFSAAIHIICGENFMAPAERWGMLEHVLAMKRGRTDEPLDFCNHSTSRDGGIRCAAQRDGEQGPELEARFEAVRERWPGKTIDALRERADAFLGADAFWEAEQSREGTMYAYAETHARLNREEEFLEVLDLYTQERAPAASEAELKHADAELNAAYRKRLAAIEPCDSEYQNCSPPLEPENLRNAQRAWIPYRDAWIAFYQHRWRGTAPPAALRREIAAALTRLRTGELAIP